MTHELAYRLYRKGFSYTRSTPLNAIPIAFVPTRNKGWEIPIEFWLPPSLTSLIGAIGEDFGMLEHKADGHEWVARPTNRHPDYTKGGDNADEVLGLMWLALQNKDG